MTAWAGPDDASGRHVERLSTLAGRVDTLRELVICGVDRVI